MVTHFFWDASWALNFFLQISSILGVSIRLLIDIYYGIDNNKQYHLYNRADNLPFMESINLITKKGASCTDLLTCLYNLKPTDLKILMAVAKNENATLDQIAKIVQRDRSSVHRCLSKLLSAGLIHKKSQSLKAGGYYHTYAMLDPETIKKHARERVQEITESLQSLIDGFESDLKRHLEQS